MKCIHFRVYFNPILLYAFYVLQQTYLHKYTYTTQHTCSHIIKTKLFFNYCYTLLKIRKTQGIKTCIFMDTNYTLS